MGKSISFTCDCGCEATTKSQSSPTSWFVVSQERNREHSNVDPKIKRELHFATLKCAASWFGAAAKELPGLQKSARGLSPRGKISTEDVPGLYV